MAIPQPPQTTAYPEAPQRGEAEAVFIPKANTFVAALEPRRVELQSLADYTYARAVNVETLNAESVQAAADAVNAAQLAAVNSRIYPDTASGVADTPEGEYFSVPGPNADDYLTLYRVVSGVATEIDVYPNKQAVIDAKDAVLAELASSDPGQGSDLIAHTGTSDTVTEALDKRTIYVGSVADSVADYAASATDGQQYIAAGYLPGVFALADPSTRGGGRLIYVAGVAKSNHNGVTIFSGTVPKISGQTGADLREKRDAFITGTGETDPSGYGCFIRLETGTVHTSWAGTFADETNLDTVALQAAIDATIDTLFIDKGAHLTDEQLTVDKIINIHGVGAERTANEGSHIRHNGTGDALVYSDTIGIYDRTLKNFSVTSVTGHALHLRYGTIRCEYLNLRLDSRALNKSAIFGDYTSYGIGLFTNRFIGGEYFGSNTLARSVPIVDLLTSATLLNENVFRDMWVSYSKGVVAMRVRAVGAGIRLTNNKFESITYEVCEGGLLELRQCSHSKIDGVSAWDSPSYTGDLVTLDSCSATTVIGYGRIGGTPDAGVVDIRATGSGGGLTVINFSDVGAVDEAIDWGGQSGNYIGPFSATRVDLNASRVVFVEGDRVRASEFTAADGSNAVLSGTGNAQARLLSEHSGVTRRLSWNANSFYGGNGALYPDDADLIDLGAPSKKWKTVHAANYRAGGLAGVSGTFTTADSKTVTVTGGIITGIA